MAKKPGKRSRQGRHPDHYVMLGGMVPPRKKAIAIVTAAVVAGKGNKLAVLDLLWKGVENIANMFGVIDKNGEVTEQYRDVVAMTEYSIGENQKAARAKRASEKGRDE